MTQWKITYLPGSGQQPYKIIQSEVMRMATYNGDYWFCDECDKKATGDYLPKFILAKGSYLNIERVDPEEEQPKTMSYNKAQVKKAKIMDEMDWI